MAAFSRVVITTQSCLTIQRRLSTTRINSPDSWVRYKYTQTGIKIGYDFLEEGTEVCGMRAVAYDLS